MMRKRVAGGRGHSSNFWNKSKSRLKISSDNLENLKKPGSTWGETRGWGGSFELKLFGDAENKGNNYILENFQNAQKPLKNRTPENGGKITVRNFWVRNRGVVLRGATQNRPKADPSNGHC